MKKITIREFFEAKKKDFALSVVTESKTLENFITEPQINRPGLALSGFYERFAYKRIQIFGETEICYLQSMDSDSLYKRLKEVMGYSIPVIIVTKGLSVPQQLEFLANDFKIAVLTSRLTTDRLIVHLDRYLRDLFSPQKSIHGTLVDVFSVGILLTGKSGIGKSECALDLVERGHRLIADDVVKINLKDDDLIGSPVIEFGHFMEVRGVGIIDVERMFGIQGIRKSCIIDTQVELMLWKDNMDYERIGLTNNYTEILGINTPIIYLPVSPGKNVSVVIEVIALNHILKKYGYEAAEVYQRKLQEQISRKSNND